MRKTFSRVAMATVVLIGAGLLSAQAQAQQEVKLEIPAQPLADSLRALGFASNTNIIFDPGLVDGLTAPALSLTTTTREALVRLLAGTQLRFRFVDDKTVSLMPPSEKNEPVKTGAQVADAGVMRLSQADETQNPTVSGSMQNGAEDNKGRAAQSSAGATENKSQEIVVTGTHIKGVSNATAPVITWDREAIERTGYSTTEDLFESLPQNFGGGQSGASADGLFGNGAFRLLNYSAGTGINLRGIGASSTLVLINGHRVAPAAFGAFVDISAIPLSAVERVEILADGSSAIYGSDAVAGVVNILLKKNPEGAEVSARYGSASGGTRDEKTLAGSFGTRWNGGGAILSAQHQDLAPLLTRERSFASSALQPSTLMPETVNSSVLMNVGQDIGTRGRAGVDVLYTRRDVWAQEAASFIPLVDTSDVTQDDLSIAPTLQLALAERWSVDINPLFARQKLDKQMVRRYQTGAIETSSDIASFELSSLDALTSFRLMHLPAGEVAVAAGAAYRDEQFDDRLRATNGLLAGLKVGRHVTSAFTEFYVPLVGPAQRKRGMAGLDLSAAVRWDSYSDFGDTTNPRVGLLWTVGETLSVRGSYSHSFRAPTVMELNNAIRGIVGVGVLPFAGPTGAPTPVLIMSGARSDLSPERAKSASLGFDFTPASVPGLTFGATYYRIRYTDRILTPSYDPAVLSRLNVYGGLVSTFTSDAEVQAFVNSMVAAGGSFFDGTPGQTGVTGVRYSYDLRQQNAARLHQDGFDFTAAYRVQLGGVGLSLRANTTNVQEILTAYRGSTQYSDQVNTYGNPPKMRTRFDMGLDTKAWSFNAALNSYGSYTNTQVPGGASVDSWLTVDLAARLDIGALSAAPAAAGLTLQFSAQNVLDEDPPFVDLGRPNTVRYDSANANPLGRFLALELRKRW